MGIRSPNGVKCHLSALQSKGYIEIDRGVARGIRLTDEARTLGRVVGVLRK
jgi:SOS-response transcriptional repressor LexA